MGQTGGKEATARGQAGGVNFLNAPFVSALGAPIDKGRIMWRPSVGTWHTGQKSPRHGRARRISYPAP
jgi:hypothetical protein